MEHAELIIFGLLCGIAGLAVLAGKLGVPYPITLVAGGAVIGFVPGVPDVQLDPDLVLLIFLPPLLYGAAFFTDLRDLRRNARPIALLAIPLVLVTMCAVAVVAHGTIGLGWPEAFVLGAIVSPTDAVAPAEILRRLNAPRRLLIVIEGESLTNDGTALVLYKVAVAAVVTGSFSFWDAGLKFVANGLGGLAIGLAVGWIIKQVRARIDDPPTEITISLLSGYAAYLPAEELGLSGVIAAVTVGYLRRLAHAQADHAAGAHAGHRGLGDPHLPAQCRALPACRAPAAVGARSHQRTQRRRAHRVGRAGQRRGDRRAPDLAVHGRLPDPSASTGARCSGRGARRGGCA